MLVDEAQKVERAGIVGAVRPNWHLLCTRCRHVKSSRKRLASEREAFDSVVHGVIASGTTAASLEKAS
jgi:hypothetical protein